MTDPAHYDGREQAIVKHSLLEKYLPQWAYRVGREWEKLVYVDAFAGPWQVACPQYSDSSFGVAISSLKNALVGLRQQWKRDVDLQAVLLATSEAKRKELEAYAASQRSVGISIDALRGEFAEQIDAISAAITADKKKDFRFVFLDPKGWAQIPMQQMAPFLQARSCEVLVTLMTRHISRFLDQPDRAESYIKLFGREGVLQQLRECPKPLRTERAAFEYGRSLRMLCGFKYVSRAVVLRPDREEVLYYLMFATNHPRGIEVFKDAEMKAAQIQDSVRIETQARRDGQPEFQLDGDGQKTQLVQELRGRYCRQARARVFSLLIERNPNSVPYADLFCAAMALPLVTPDDLVSWIVELPDCLRLNMPGEKRRVPTPDESRHQDTVSVINLDALRTELKRAQGG